ncbi:hypothetical protein CYY_009891 [Polysphondylium violaceum]|uniref:OB fold-containing protein n=1 Tax=Polysphondylium violaceum TaxID=133409 RepID=A0A8J4V2I6_9MYCE|nr:hypothetical protein CYY_009891 [Polysphondylium violaceum]
MNQQQQQQIPTQQQIPLPTQQQQVSSPMQPSQQHQSHNAFLKIIEIKPFNKNINCVFIVLDKGQGIKKKEGTIFQVLVADSTAAINMTLWDVIGEQVQPGDILRLKGGYSTIYIDLQNLYVGKAGLIEKIGEFNMNFVEHPNLSSIPYSVQPDPINPKNMIATPKNQPPPLYKQQQQPLTQQTPPPPQQQQLKQPPQPQPPTMKLP